MDARDFTARRDRESEKGISITGSWDLNIPSDLLYEILSYLGWKDNIIASAVCKTWLEVAVSVRNSEPRPLLFYPQRGSSDDGNYVLLDPSRSATYNLNFRDLKGSRFYCSRDDWLLVWRKSPSDLIFFLNPFTRERVYLPKGSCYSKDDYCLAFSAAPTSTSCLVISLSRYTRFHKGITYSVINTWQLGESVWTTHHLERPLPLNHRERYFWDNCLFSNGIFYCLSPSGVLGVFDPSRETWNILQVRSFPGSLSKMLMTEHEGDIFVISTRWGNKKSVVFKLNLIHKVWEEKRGWCTGSI
ncbi:hypothetical protein Bca101_018225 [Brassica carinata]